MDLKNYAKKEKIKYFMVTYTDLFGVQRAKLVPASAISDMQKDGAGFAGFASWLDMTPAYPDMLAVPDPQSVIKLPWKKDVAWLASNERLKLLQTNRSNHEKIHGVEGLSLIHI